MSTLERAIAIAATAHEGQPDKAGQPYILHPLRVMFRLSDPEDRIVGVLHDVVEDGEGWTLDRLRSEGFSDTILEAVDAVTKRPHEEEEKAYEDFVRRAARNSIGRRVKLADLEDNSDLSRLSNPTELDYERIEKYRKAIDLIHRMELEEEMKKSPNSPVSI